MLMSTTPATSGRRSQQRVSLSLTQFSQSSPEGTPVSEALRDNDTTGSTGQRIDAQHERLGHRGALMTANGRE